MVTESIFELTSQDETERFAACLATHIKPLSFNDPFIMTFQGDLGTGKTTFIRAMLKRLGITTAIKSPTYALVESYDCLAFEVHHFDLYRLTDEIELEYIGFKDYFTKHSICCIEWPERAPHCLSNKDVAFNLFVKGEGRLLQVRAFKRAGIDMLVKLAKEFA